MNKLARFQQAAVEHIVGRLRDKAGSRRMLLADEVGLGKTVVARGVLESLCVNRRRPLTVVYLCSNAEIAEQNRQKLDPNSRRSIGRVTELALERPDRETGVLLYSFTPGTSLSKGTGLVWERQLLMYLLRRIYGLPVATKSWREFFRCGAGEERWHRTSTLRALSEEYERKTSLSFQAELASAWRHTTWEGSNAIGAVRNMVPTFDPDRVDQRIRRNSLIATLRGVMQKVALRHLQPDLVILDEVQRFREVLDHSEDPSHIAAELFARHVPVLILSATPYRALTLGHELAEDGASSHHEDFFKTLDFLFDTDKKTPVRIKDNLRLFGERLRGPKLADQADAELLALKRLLEADLTKVISRTERNWYVLDQRNGVDDHFDDRGTLPARAELEEFFLLHGAFRDSAGRGQVTEFWKSAPSLLTFLDARYQLFRSLRDDRTKVRRSLLTPAAQVQSLTARNHRIARVVDVALGADEEPPRLWTSPTYSYYRDEFFGPVKPRKVLVFSGWRFVPKTVAVIASRVASNRIGGDSEDPSQPLRFTDRRSFHVFDVCFPSPVLSAIGHEAYAEVRKRPNPTANHIVDAAERLLRRHLRANGAAVVPAGGDSTWQAVMRLEARQGNRHLIYGALEASVESEEDTGSAAPLRQHCEWVAEWLDAERGPISVSAARVRHLALVAAFSPANCLFRAYETVYGSAETTDAFASVVGLCLGSMRRYFNRPHVQQTIRRHQFRLDWRDLSSEDRGFAERTLIYSADAHLQAVLDEYAYLQRHAAQADTVERATLQLGGIWALARGNPRTNGASGTGSHVRIHHDAEVHAAHFALAFGEDVARDEGPDGDDDKLRKSVVREAFNSPFWPFVLATTSVGQEGLDFHLYCRDVLHWNLPSNPVDLEQREGRVNRRDCLAVRESIALDWALTDPALTIEVAGRNPWPGLFDTVETHDAVQRYKHGLFPHWVYECRDPQRTVKIKRHVPFFSTSKDSAKYERLKVGLALYRLVFGQANQEDLLDTLQRQATAVEGDERERRLRRLRGYMLNLSPIGHAQAREHALDEADAILRDDSGRSMADLVDAVRHLQLERPMDLAEVKTEIDGLIGFVQAALAGPGRRSSRVRRALASLAYLRNPYDHIFDLHVEGGFTDDIAELREAWRFVQAQAVPRPPSDARAHHGQRLDA